MYARDLELGPLSTRPRLGKYENDFATSQKSASSETLWASSYYERTDSGREGLSVIPEKETRGAYTDSPASEDEQYVKLPRPKVEQLMGMWIDLLQQNLKVDDLQRPLLPVSEQPRLEKRRRLSSYKFGQYPPILRSKDEQPWSTVERMSEAEIQAENGYRRLRRTEWRSSSFMTDLEDSWRYLCKRTTESLCTLTEC